LFLMQLVIGLAYCIIAFPIWYLRGTTSDSLSQAWCLFNSDGDTIVVLTDKNFLKISKRDSTTGAELSSIKESNFGYAIAGDIIIQ